MTSPRSENKAEHKGIALQAAQHNMAVFRQLYPQSNVYHHTVAMNLEGKLDVPILEKALHLLAKRHEALRSSFSSTGDVVQQVFIDDLKNDSLLKELDARNQYPKVPPIEELQKILKPLKSENILLEPFNLAKGPLWRVALIQFEPNKYQLLFVFDHIIVDVASQNVLLQDLTQIYNALLENKTEIKLPDKPHLIDIKPSEEKHSKKLSFWQDQLKGLSPLSLNTDFKQTKKLNFRGDRIYFKFEPKELAKIKNFIAQHNNETKDGHKVSFHMFFLTTLYILLYRYTSSTDICIGTASANRRGFNVTDHELNKVVNCFVNSVPLRADLSGNPSFQVLLERVKKIAINAYQNQLPLNEITEKALPVKNNIATPFDIIFVLNEVKTKLNFKNIEASEPIELNLKNTKFQFFGLELDHKEDGSLDGFIEFNTELFKKSTFERFLGHWRTLLNATITTPHLLLSEIPILTSEEKQQLIKFNDTEKKPIFNEFIHELFSKRVQTTPNLPAVYFHKESGDKEIKTWKELDAMVTTTLTILLNNVGDIRNQIIGICLQRSIHIVAAMLAIHKAGGIFVALDTTPGDVLTYKLKDTKTRIVLTDNSTTKLFNVSGIKTVNITDLKTINTQEYKFQFKPIKTAPQDIASIYYTSGTTGKRKGVIITHSGQRNLLNEIADRNLKSGAQFLSVADIRFDGFWFDITQWIATEKAILHIVNTADSFTPKVLTRIIQQEKIDHVVLLSNLLAQLDPKQLPSIKVAITMGAVPDARMLESWRKACVEIHNEWGPTENTVCGTRHKYIPGEPSSSIGSPIVNEQIHIVNPIDKSICPIGVPGEIFVTGSGLAKGYLNDPKLTQQRFPKLQYNSYIPRFELKNSKDLTTSGRKISFQQQPVLRAYETGDFGYRLESGNIVFLGRKDNQIKINGIRIGLDEIREIVQTHSLIAEVVIIKDPNNYFEKEFLTAYVTLKNIELKTTTESKKGLESKDTSMAHLFSELNQLLGSNGIPPSIRFSSVMIIDKFPLNFSGKIDVKALPPPIHHEEKMVLPETPLQIQLRNLWAEILNIAKDKISMTDAFSALGGDSPMLAKLVTRINTTFKLNPGIEALDIPFESTILEIEKKLTSFLTKQCASPSGRDPSEFGFRSSTPPLSPSLHSHGLWSSEAQKLTEFKTPKASASGIIKSSLI